MKKENLWGLTRITMGWIFLWAFLDKLFGWGFATKAGKSWLDGVSPTEGFLKNSPTGPLAEFFKGLAGNTLVDWAFMLGLLFVGVGLLLGTWVRLAAYAGSIMMFLMWLSMLPPKNNPVVDEHIVYILVLLTLASVGAGQYLGLSKWWKKQGFVKGKSILE